MSPGWARVRVAVRGVAAAVMLACLLLGLPAALLALGPSPLTVRLPAPHRLVQVLMSPDDGTALLTVVRAIAWLGWLTFALSTLGEVVAAIAGRSLPLLRALAPLHRPAAYLVAAIVAALPLSTAAAAATPVLPVAVAAAPQSPGGTAARAPSAAALPATPAHVGHGTVAVRRYDSLWTIAQHHLGAGRRWTEIYALNVNRPQPDGAALTDPTHIEPGWILVLPADVSPSPTYTVAPGDQLRDIAARLLGSPERYHDIAARNQQLINGNPDHIEPGWQLTLPPGAHDRGTRPHATGRAAVVPAGSTPLPPPQRTGPPPTSAPGQAPPNPPPAPAPQPKPPTRPDPPITPTGSRSPTRPSQSPAPIPSGGHPPTPSTSDHSTNDQHTGVDLPDAWVTLPLAAALAAAGAMVWLRRRHRYVPGPIARQAAEDPDLRPLPPAVTALRRTVRQQTPDLLDRERDRAQTVAEAVHSSQPPEAPAPGPDGPTLAGFGTLPPDGLGLTGPGAHAAARGLLVAALSTGSPDDPDARSDILIPTATLTTLIGDHQTPATPRLRPAQNFDAALNTTAELLIERHRLLDQHGAADLAELHEADPYHPPITPLLLITAAPTPDQQARLAATAQQGAPVAIGALVLDEWPPGKTISIEDDGTITGAEPATETGRVTVLDVATTTQLLDMLAESHTSRPSTVDNPAAQSEPTPAEPEPTPAVDVPAILPVTQHRVSIRPFGTPAVLDAAGAPVPGLRHHATGLLVYLALHRDGANLPDIMEAFWPTATIRRASERLSTEVANLRRAIRTAAGNTKIQPVVNTGSRYHLDQDVLAIDLWTLADAMRHPFSTDALAAAVDAYTGPLADGLDYDWLEQHREHGRRLAITVLLRLADAAHGADPAAERDLLNRASELDPYSDDLARRAITAAVRAGDADTAGKRYERLRTALAELDEEPSFSLTGFGADEPLRERDRPGPRGRLS
jgi:DNA-binding SARP family transcriptional activator